MLIRCPECELQVSDSAFSCPHCGYPMKPMAIKRRHTTKRKRLPNGFGQISEIKSSNLRKPFRAMITIGKTEFGKPISRLLKPEAYFATYNEAYEALLAYHKDPLSMNQATTFSQLFEKWYNESVLYTRSEKDQQNINYVWQYCSALYNKRIKDTTIHDIKQCIETASAYVNGDLKDAPEYVKVRMKNIISNLYDYALEYNIVQINLAKAFKLHREEKVKEYKEPAHKSFADDELKLLWNNRNLSQTARMITINCYSGWRPAELCGLHIENIDLVNWVFKGGNKTKSGINRTVPIHEKIRELVKFEYDASIERDSKYLFTNQTTGNVVEYDKYKYAFKRFIKEHDMDKTHRPHDSRKTFVTLAKKYNMNEYAIKRIVGHQIDDLTERVYTDRSIDWLREELEKIK